MVGIEGRAGTAFHLVPVSSPNLALGPFSLFLPSSPNQSLTLYLMMSNSSSLPICQFLGDANWTFLWGKEDYTGRKHNRVPRGTERRSGTSEVLGQRPERNCLRGSRCKSPVAGILERVEPEGSGIAVPIPRLALGPHPLVFGAARETVPLSTHHHSPPTCAGHKSSSSSSPRREGTGGSILRALPQSGEGGGGVGSGAAG